MSGDKKFNVWVVYADLFSNLSTFLFISAFGMFAALGSGALRTPTVGGPTPPPGVLVCAEKATAVGRALGEKPRYYTPKFIAVSDQGLPPEKCSRYFAVTDYRFQREKTDVKYMSPDGDPRRRFQDATFKKTLCEPLWGAVVRARHTGDIKIIGIASVLSAAACRTKRDAGPRFVSSAKVFSSRGESFEMTAEELAACEAGGHGSSARCRAAMSCLSKSGAAHTLRWCDRVIDVRADANTQCLVNVGHFRAQSFAQYCQQVVEGDFVDTKPIRDAGEDFIPVNLESKWLDRVKVEGAYVVSNGKNKALRDGTIVIGIQQNQN